ncbi:nuclear transport factor 2 family protein [Streptomyces sp. NPDC046821]|uniref:nuclear transport factor 2 family protein n=1 Tax=Streptomyces sp. NPDC046821 TaxID=3154702 RepID=UPI0033C211D8
MSTAVDSMNDLLALRRLVDTYALAMDRRDAALMAEVFAPDGRLVVHGLDGSVKEDRGTPEARNEILDQLSVFKHTFHLVGNHLADVDGSTATGTVYCLAHHYSAGPDGSSDVVVPVRYEDEYVRTADGWRIAVRAVHALWYEQRTYPAAGA